MNRFLCRHTATAPRIKLCHQSMQIRLTRNTSVTLYLYISQRNMPARFVPAGMSTNAAFITNATSTYKCAHFQQLINGQLFRFHVAVSRFYGAIYSCRITALPPQKLIFPQKSQLHSNFNGHVGWSICMLLVTRIRYHLQQIDSFGVSSFSIKDFSSCKPTLRKLLH